MVTTSTLNRLRYQLLVDEGCVLHAYADSQGYLTIGVGRLIDQRKGGGITESEALVLLDHDIERTVNGLSLRFPAFARLDTVRQAALINMAFNLGVNGLATFEHTLAAVWDGAYDTAAVGMLNSKWASQVGNRALRLAEQMRTGRWADTEVTRA